MMSRIILLLTVFIYSLQVHAGEPSFRARYGIDNPNRELVRKLQVAGVSFNVCGQTMAFGGFAKEELVDSAKVTLSAMTMLTVLQTDGYALLR